MNLRLIATFSKQLGDDTGARWTNAKYTMANHAALTLVTIMLKMISGPLSTSNDSLKAPER